MNYIHLEIDQFNLLINVAIRIVAAIIFLIFIIPLQIKEAGVKNGLRSLRKELLLSGVIIFLVNTIGMSIIIFKYLFGDTILNSVTNAISLFNSLGFLAISILKYKIYHAQYTPENKRLHEKIEELEREESR